MEARRFGPDLRVAIEAEGITQEEMERRSGITQSTISKILAGADPKYSTFQALERALPCLREMRRAVV